jgi:hypothetical protein
MRNALSRRPSPWGAAFAVVLLIGALGTVSVVVADRAGCSGVAAASIAETSKFTPYGNRLTTLSDVAIGGQSDSAAVPARTTYAASSIDGLARQYTIDASNGSVYSYFLDADTANMMHSDFVKLGGLELQQDASDQSFATYLLKELGERAVGVEVGSFDGALTWADPDENGIRTHNLYWFDGIYNYALIGDRSATDIVNLGRHLVCG